MKITLKFDENHIKVLSESVGSSLVAKWVHALSEDLSQSPETVCHFKQGRTRVPFSHFSPQSRIALSMGANALPFRVSR